MPWNPDLWPISPFSVGTALTLTGRFSMRGLRMMLVVRGGTPLYGRDALLTALPEFNSNGCEPIDVCGEAQRVCIKQETGETLGSLEAGVSGGTFETYPLFFCDTPVDEPTCVPSRPGEFSGQASDEDWDGDGIVNDEDNCPDVFNPFRPVDGGIQTDKDSDGLGDVCDPCPFDADTTACTSVNPDDLDGDGTVNAADNCVNIPNEDQLDTDSDGKGDPCDPCPEYSNPGNQGCLTPIYDIASGLVAENEAVFVEDMVVTAVEEMDFSLNSIPPLRPTQAVNSVGSGCTTVEQTTSPLWERSWISMLPISFTLESRNSRARNSLSRRKG